MRRILIIIICIFPFTEALGQHNDTTEYLYPVRNVLGFYSANFGELRPGHFHGGVDIKTDGAVGRPLVAVADGYISRLSVSPGGYGRALYVTLRNGKTAVYGHLSRFRKDIEERVASERRNRRENALNLWFSPEQYPVSKGNIIAFSGNSGTSFGPHLHFELRDTPTQRTLNTVRLGVIRPKDQIPPLLLRLHYLEVDTLGGIPVHSPIQSYDAARVNDSTYRLVRTDPVETGRKGYFVIEASDRRNDVANTFGLYRVSASVDGEKQFEYRMDGFTFDLSRCCDAVSYYPLQISSRNEVIRLARLDGSPDCFYSVMRERGIVRTKAGQKRRIRIEAEDDCGNVSALEFDILGRTDSFRADSAEGNSSAAAIHRNRAACLCIGNELTARIPAGTLYESIYCRPERLSLQVPVDSALTVLTPAYRVFDASTPLFNAVTVHINLFIPRNLESHAALATRDRKGRISYLGGSYTNGQLTARTRTSGVWFVVADTIPPRIVPLFTSGKDLSKASALRFRVSDNFSGIGTCTLLIDGQWVPCDRYPVQGALEYRFDTPAARSSHQVNLTVEDQCGNKAVWRGTFYR